MTLAIEEKKYELEKMPEILHKEVEEYLNNFQARIIAANVRESRPYKDKSIVDTTYSVYVEYGNLLSVFKYRICTKPEFSDNTVRHDSMIAGDVDVFINNSTWFKEYKRSDLGRSPRGENIMEV